MIEIAATTTGLLVLFTLCFVLLVVAFIKRIYAEEITLQVSERLPKAAVLLSLRGTDPRLEDCLRALFRQNYPAYQTCIVVDSEADPAWAMVHRVAEETGARNKIIEPLCRRLGTCSLKCSALLQMTEDLDPSIEVVALIDGDVVPHPTWLRELVSPLVDKNVGATFGIPWFTPPRGQWGSVMRQVWWSLAAIVMALFGWTWGGTVALRTEVLHRSGLLERWSQAMSSDTPIHNAVTRLGLEIEWVPSLTMANLEECNLRHFFDQLARYLLVARLYLPLWPAICIVIVSLTITLGLAVGVLMMAALEGEGMAAAVAGAGIGSYLFVLMILLVLVDTQARRVLRRNGVDLPRLTVATLFKLQLAIPAVHGLYFVGMMRAHFVRRVIWRGAQYAVEGRWKIRSLDAAPLRSPVVPNDPEKPLPASQHGFGP